MWKFGLIPRNFFSGNTQMGFSLRVRKKCKGWRSANKFRKSQIRQFGDLIFFGLAGLPQMWQFADLRFADHIFFAICGFANCGPIYYLFKTSSLCSLKYVNVGKKNLTQTNADLDQKHCFFLSKFEEGGAESFTFKLCRNRHKKYFQLWVNI